jgi:hypothetical protein
MRVPLCMRIGMLAIFIFLMTFQVSSPPNPVPTGLWISNTARTQLQNLPGDRTYEHLACMIGAIDHNVARIDSIVPVAVDSLHEAKLWVAHQNACVSMPNVVGIVHSHPDTDRCWYKFPGTDVPTSDEYGAKSSPFPIDAISCDGKWLVWINKDGLEQRISL